MVLCIINRTCHTSTRDTISLRISVPRISIAAPRPFTRFAKLVDPAAIIPNGNNVVLQPNAHLVDNATDVMCVNATTLDSRTSFNVGDVVVLSSPEGSEAVSIHPLPRYSDVAIFVCDVDFSVPFLLAQLNDSH